MSEDYYRPSHLAEFSKIGDNRPELAQKFFDYYGAVMGEGVLSRREKALIALAVSHVLQCPYCIDAYSKTSLEAGADLDQMTEAVHVASALRAGATLVHGMQMKTHHDAISM